MRRVLLLILLTVTVTILAPTVGAQTRVSTGSASVSVIGATAGDDTTSTTREMPASQGIIPRPNSGTAPSEAGDRGGSLQSFLFFGLVAAVAGIGAIVYRQSARARRDRGY